MTSLGASLSTGVRPGASLSAESWLLFSSPLAS